MNGERGRLLEDFNAGIPGHCEECLVRPARPGCSPVRLVQRQETLRKVELIRTGNGETEVIAGVAVIQCLMDGLKNLRRPEVDHATRSHQLDLRCLFQTQPSFSGSLCHLHVDGTVVGEPEDARAAMRASLYVPQSIPLEQANPSSPSSQFGRRGRSHDAGPYHDVIVSPCHHTNVPFRSPPKFVSSMGGDFLPVQNRPSICACRIGLFRSCNGCNRSATVSDHTPRYHSPSLAGPV